MDNITAKVSCFARAFHHKENAVHVFDDNVAELLLGNDYDQIAGSMLDGMEFFLPGFKGTAEEGLRIIVDKQLSPSVLVRSAICEKELCERQRQGLTQYVAFASGYDTFAIRNDNKDIYVFELDKQEVLDDKRLRIKGAGIESRAEYVPCDLAEKFWVKSLLESGFSNEKKVFCSMLGISYYLSHNAFEDLLKSAGAIMAGGSAICFDYPTDEEGDESKTNRMLAAGAGENMKEAYSKSEIESLLVKCGFKVLEHMDYNDATEKCCQEYNARNPEHEIMAPEGVNYIIAEK